MANTASSITDTGSGWFLHLRLASDEPLKSALAENENTGVLISLRQHRRPSEMSRAEWRLRINLTAG